MISYEQVFFRFLAVVLLNCSVLFLSAQWTPLAQLPVYPSDEVTTIRIEMDPADLELLYFADSLFSNYEYPATFIFESDQLTDTVENVGFRLRGNTSRLAAKKSFKVSFNTFSAGAKWNGLEKLNLNGEHNDPSIMRSKLGWEMAQQAGLIAPFVSYTRLYVNDIYAGLYINVEHYDEQFLQSRFGSDAGNLYKCHYPANLDFISNNPDDYKAAPWDGPRTYELKTNTEADDYSGLAHFIDVLNNTASNALPCELEKVFDVQKYLRAVAFELVIGHWDGYVFNNNNFYLYQRPSDGRFEFIQYDIDNTAGIDWFGNDWTTQNIYNYTNSNRPLYERLIANDTYRDQFSYFVYEFMTEFAPIDDIEARANQLLELISEAGLEDEFRTFDYGFSDDDFLNAKDEAWGNHVAFGILPYYENRYGWNYVQLETIAQPVLFSAEDNAPLVNPELTVSVSPVFPAETVVVSYALDGGVAQTIDLNDSGIDGDSVEGDGIWETSLNLEGLGDFVEYSVTVNSNGTTGTQACATKVWITQANDNLVLNEVMSDNEAFIADAFGEFDDWFELWNGNGAPVLPSNYWVSDNLDQPLKFKLGGSAIPAGGFNLLWADHDEEQGINHCNFAIEDSGEELLILKIQDGSMRLVDYIDFGQLAPDISYGREVDGAPNWINFETPTPNSANGIVDIVSYGVENVLPYPNPTTGILHLPTSGSWTFHNISGKQVSVPMYGSTANLESLSPGVYLLKSEGRIIRILKK